MNDEKPQKVRTVITKQKQKNGDIYVLERQTVYDSVKKFNRVIKTKLIGKIQKGTDNVVETRPKKNKNEIQINDSSKLTATREHIGMTDILDFIGKTSMIDKGIYDNIDIGSAQKIISIARYTFCSNGSTLPGLETFQLNHPLPYKYPITGDVYCDLFAQIGRNETFMQNFFMSRAEILGDTDSIAFDSSTISTYSTNQIEARQGFNKAHDGLDTIKFLTLYSTTYKMPIAFTKLSGNIPDVVTQLNGIKQLRAIGINPRELITDNGFYSEKNIAALLLSEYYFITRVNVGLKWIYPEIDSHIKEFDSIKTACSFESTTHCVTLILMKEFHKERKYASKAKNESKGEDVPFTRRIYLHLYYNKARAIEEESKFNNDLFDIKAQIESGTKFEDLSKTAQSKANKYLIISKSRKISFNEEACAEKNKYNGFFALIADKEKDGEQCLLKYRKREYIEESYRSLKQHTDMNHVRCWTTDVLRGRMFVQFVALCYYEYMAYLVRNLKEESKKIIKNKENTYTKEEVKKEQKLLTWVQKKSLYNQLRWFDTVEGVKISSQIRKIRWSTETLENDRLYLKRLGMLDYTAKV